MNSLAHSLCAYLCSRNNDIAGYWGIGMLCADLKKREEAEVQFQDLSRRVAPNLQLRDYGFEESSRTSL